MKDVTFLWHSLGPLFHMKGTINRFGHKSILADPSLHIGWKSLTKYFPNVNPIELLWDHLQLCVHSVDPPPYTLQQLWDARYQ